MLQRFMYFGWERNELKKSHRVKFNSVFVLKKKKSQMASCSMKRFKVASLGFRFNTLVCYQKIPYPPPPFAVLY